MRLASTQTRPPLGENQTLQRLGQLFEASLLRLGLEPVRPSQTQESKR